MAYIFDKTGIKKTITDAELAAASNDGSYVIVLDHGTATDGRSYWLYLAVQAPKYREFAQLVARRATVRFKDYGTILRYGYERTVPDPIKLEMKEKHGIDEAYMQWLIADADKERQAFLKEKEVQENKRIGDIVAMLKAKQQQ